MRMPVKGREGLYDISSKKLSGKIEAIGPDQVKADEFDLRCSSNAGTTISFCRY